MLLIALSYDMRSPAVVSRIRSADLFVALSRSPTCFGSARHIVSTMLKPESSIKTTNYDSAGGL